MKSAEKIELIRNLMPPKPIGLDGKPKDYRSRHYQWIEDLLLIVKKQNIKIAELKRSQQCLADHLEAVLNKNSVEVKSNENESFYASSLPVEKLKRLLTALAKAKIIREEVRKLRGEKVKEKKSD